MKPAVDLLVTLWPSFPHFRRFAYQSDICGIRLNSAMMDAPDLDKELNVIKHLPGKHTGLFFDVKARQPRVVEVIHNKDRLDLRLNHPIAVNTPTTVIFKGGTDHAVLDHLEEGGQRLVFHGGPRFNVKAGESLYLRDPSLSINGPLFTDLEIAKIETVKAAGFKKYFLSYVEKQSDVDQFLEMVGHDCEVWLKIESMRGLRFVKREFVKRDGLVLVAARGDLYVEIDRPHMMSRALQLIIDKDPEACAASRILLSVVDKVASEETLWKYRDSSGNVFFLPRPQEGTVFSPIDGSVVSSPPEKTYLNDASKITCNPVPSCADFLELNWMHSVGYRRFMLCDEMCLREDLLTTSVDAFNAWRSSV